MRWVEKDRKRNWRSGRRKSTEMRYFDENVLFFYESRNKCEERAGPKAGNEMGVFCKKWTFPQRRVHYVQYRYFLFCILLIWVGVRTHPTHPPAYRPVRSQTSSSVT